MKKVVIFPFLRLAADCVSAGDWVFEDENRAPVGEFFPDWECNTAVRVSQSVEIRSSRVYEVCGLDPQDKVTVACSWYSPGTSIRGSGSLTVLRHDCEVEEAVLRLEALGGLLAGEIRFRTFVLLMSPRREGSLAAHLPGSILWQQEKALLLEGHGSRFPVEVVDFGELGWLPAQAAWFLDWMPTQPEANLFGGSGIRLLVNKASPNVYEAVVAKKPTVEQCLIRSAIYHDVGRSLIRGMLTSVEYVEDPKKYPEGTVGYHVHVLSGMIFPGEPADVLFAQMKDKPEHFEAQLKQGLRLFETG